MRMKQAYRNISRSTVCRCLFALLSAALLFTGCGSTVDFLSYKESAKTEYDNGLHDQEIVLKAGGEEVCYAEFRYYFLSEQNELPQGVWDTYTQQEKEDFIQNKVIKDILFGRSAALLAERHAVALSEEEQKGIEVYIDQAVEESGGKESFTADLRDMFMTLDLYRFITYQDQLMSKLYLFYTSEATTPTRADDQAILSSAESGALIRVKHILLLNQENADAEENRIIAEDIQRRAAAGADFDQLVAEYSQDPALENEPDGCYIYRFEMNDAFDKAAFALAPGEVSEVVSVNTAAYSGYHIIKRYEVEKEYVESNLNSLRANYMVSQLYQEIEQISAETEVVMTDKLKELLPDQIQ